MRISEVNAFASLVQKATSFVIQLEERRYKGEINLKTFKDKVWMLSAKHSEWTHQLQRYGISEDEHLLKLVAAAETHLDELEKYVQRLKSKRFLRWRKRVFPEQLDYYLSKILEIVDAGPQVLAAKVGDITLLETSAMHTPASLPFRQDENYVPIERSVLDVQRALEDVEGQQVVTVHAGPQLGKTSFVKHIALDIEERKTQGMGTFPDGVYYLSCGQKAKNKVEQLQLELLQGLGFGTPVPNDVIMAGGLQGQLHKMKLIARLKNKKLLIILDDLWDEKVLEELLVPSKGVRYLVTSRNKDIWIPARKIELQMPTKEEANQILANYVEGRPTKGKLPDDIQTCSHSLVRMVKMHPKALTNIGLSTQGM